MKHPARLLALLAFLSASTALADPGLPRSTTYVNAGLLFSTSARPGGGMAGYGLEVSLHDFNDKDYTSGVGLFAQFQGTNQDHSRFAGGVQGTYKLVGVELGVAYETGNRDFAGTTSLHVAPFVSALGFVTLGLRVGIPLSGPDGHKPHYGTDIGGSCRSNFPGRSAAIEPEAPSKSGGAWPPCLRRPAPGGPERLLTATVRGWRATPGAVFLWYGRC